MYAKALFILLSIPFLTNAGIVVCNASKNISSPIPGPVFTPKRIDEAKFIEALKAICPKSAQEPCVDDPKTKGQCRTAANAAGPILRSFEKYEIINKNEMAALVSLMALESVEFKYQRNVYPGRPGQGTRNMQMPNYNLLYAFSLFGFSTEMRSSANIPAVLNLLLSKDEYDFGSAAWFLTSQCGRDVRRGLQAGTQAGWEEYITGCVNTTASEERVKYWEVAMKEMAKL